MAALICAGAYDDLDLAPLARSRFDDPSRWAVEELHI